MNIKFFFFNYTTTTEIYTLSLHDALPIWNNVHRAKYNFFFSRIHCILRKSLYDAKHKQAGYKQLHSRSEEHTSELQSRLHLVCRLLLEKKNIYILLLNNYNYNIINLLQII